MDLEVNTIDGGLVSKWETNKLWKLIINDSLEICIIVNFDFTLICPISRELSIWLFITIIKRDRGVREDRVFDLLL